MEGVLKVMFINSLIFLLQPKLISSDGTCGSSPAVSGLLQSLGYSETCVSAALSLCNAKSGDSFYDKFFQAIEQLKTNFSMRTSFTHEDSTTDRPRNCADLLKRNRTVSGVYKIYPYDCCPNKPVAAYCDQVTDGGGWTVIQRRINLPVREDFARSWIEYALGFGNVEGEFWLGLDNIHALTNSVLMELRIDLEDYEKETRYAKYGKFHVGNANTKYVLDIGKYSGTAGDGFLNRHHGHPFSTVDKDNDTNKENCAKLYPGGWWFDSCHISNINGNPLVGRHESYANGINWRPWRDYHYSLKRTAMMIRPAFSQKYEDEEVMPY